MGQFKHVLSGTQQPNGGCARFTTTLNGRREAPGWSLALAHSMDAADRRWSLIGSVQTPLDGRDKPTLWLRVRFRE